MSKPVKTIGRNETLKRAVHIMDENNIGVLVIAENDKPMGVLTERDVIRRVLAKGLDLDKVKVEEVMTKNPVTIDAESSILEATRLMSEINFRRLLVTKKGKLVGLVTAKDVIEVLSA